MEKSSHKLLPGSLLISQPEPGDPRFEMSVSMLCEHDEQGSFALILNKPTNLFLNVSDFSVSPTCDTELHFPLWMGGPVQLDQCFFIYKSEKELQNSSRIIDFLYFSNSQAILQEVIELSIPFKLFIGYAGWSFYQLECEISYGWWLLNKGNSESPFHPNTREQWIENLKGFGNDLYQKGLNFIDSQKPDS